MFTFEWLTIVDIKVKIEVVELIELANHAFMAQVFLLEIEDYTVGRNWIFSEQFLVLHFWVCLVKLLRDWAIGEFNASSRSDVWKHWIGITSLIIEDANSSFFWTNCWPNWVHRIRTTTPEILSVFAHAERFHHLLLSTFLSHKSKFLLELHVWILVIAVFVGWSCKIWISFFRASNFWRWIFGDFLLHSDSLFCYPKWVVLLRSWLHPFVNRRGLGLYIAHFFFYFKHLVQFGLCKSVYSRAVMHRWSMTDMSRLPLLAYNGCFVAPVTVDSAFCSSLLICCKRLICGRNGRNWAHLTFKRQFH